MGKFKKDGAAALMHVVMIGAASPAALKKALLDLTGIHAADSAISHVAVCDAGLAGLLQAEGVGQ
jgi:hypothetical protein